MHEGGRHGVVALRQCCGSGEGRHVVTDFQHHMSRECGGSPDGRHKSVYINSS